MLTDLLSAKAEDAEAILSTSGHANVWSTLEANTVDQVKLASLALILRGQSVGVEGIGKLVASFKSLATGGDDGPWIDLVPESLVNDLARLPADRIEAVAAEWASTEEARLDRWQTEDAATFLKELSAFAASATAQNQGLLLWVCL